VAANPEPIDIAPLREQITALEQGLSELRQQPPGAPVAARLCRTFRTVSPRSKKRRPRCNLPPRGA
jgi:hypothetical protein